MTTLDATGRLLTYSTPSSAMASNDEAIPWYRLGTLLNSLLFLFSFTRISCKWMVPTSSSSSSIGSTLALYEHHPKIFFITLKRGCQETSVRLRISLLYTMRMFIASYSGTHLRIACCRIETVGLGSWVAARRKGRWEIGAGTGRVDI